MKILVLAADYPDNNGNISLFYIHTRSMFYVENGIDVDVLNFNAKESYVKDKVNVITLDEFKNKNANEYDLLVLHAANLRNHYLFLKKYGNKFKKHLFFFHGHEVLMTNKVYSKPYDYVKKNKLGFLQDFYDTIKLKVWNKYFINNKDKSYYIFVSNWMKEQFLKWTKVDEAMIADHSFITYNSVGEDFSKLKYDSSTNKVYDFVTIRGNLDGSKYCIDIVNELAKMNPNCKFLVVGKGRYFDINEKAANINFVSEHYTHKQIIDALNNSKCALMPTRTDAQGLMACEMATFGIPLITSDISVCHEVFDEFKNVGYIDNENICNIDLEKIYEQVSQPCEINKKYVLENTCNQEINIIKDIIGD